MMWDEERERKGENVRSVTEGERLRMYRLFPWLMRMGDWLRWLEILQVIVLSAIL